jgi:hypothetical protein
VHPTRKRLKLLANAKQVRRAVFCSLFAVLTGSVSCQEADNGADDPSERSEVSREERLPDDAVKMTPENDPHPPVLHVEEWEDPVMLSPVINTSGVEDSPFIPRDRDELYFFFTPEAEAPPEQQVMDEVSGIYLSQLENGEWQPPARVWLQDPGKLALDGAQFVQGDEMLFATTREGYAGIHWFSAKRRSGEWTDWQPADFAPEHEVGELHIHEEELYYHSARAGGQGDFDIWKLTKTEGEWHNPENVDALNTPDMDGWPYARVSTFLDHRSMNPPWSILPFF